MKLELFLIIFSKLIPYGAIYLNFVA